MVLTCLKSTADRNRYHSWQGLLHLLDPLLKPGCHKLLGRDRWLLHVHSWDLLLFNVPSHLPQRFHTRFGYARLDVEVLFSVHVQHIQVLVCWLDELVPCLFITAFQAGRAYSDG